MAKEKKSELLEDSKVPDKIKYSDAESKYHGGILVRLSQAMKNRDIIHPELNNQTLIEFYNDNEKLSNTYVENKKDDTDLKLASGTIEQKLTTVLSEVNRLNLTPEVIAYDKENNELIGLGKGLGDIMFKTNKDDSDDENKLIRQLELLKQGTVFIQESWNKEFKKTKKLIKGSIGKIKAESVDWTSKLEKVFEGPRRKILYLPAIYLGNMKQFDIKKQPYIFTNKLTSYQEAKSRYGGTEKDGTNIWERWKDVSRERVALLTEVSATLASTANNAWALQEVGADQVEEVFYMDKPNNEFQIYLNGTAMLPVGFPLSAVSPGGEYNIEKQVLKVVNPFFPYGRSFVSGNGLKQQVQLLDELQRLLLIKTRKSIAPPYANTSKRVISSRVLMPGRITMGIDPDALKAIGQEGQGMTNNEYAMLKELQSNIDNNTVSPQMSGQMGKSGTTAYEVSVSSSQAKKMLSLIIFSCISLETKISYLRLFNILENYFDPIGTELDEARGEIKNVYRTSSRNINSNEVRKVIPTENLPSPQEIRDEELFEGTPVVKGKRVSRKKAGLPQLEKIYLNPTQIRNAKLLWYIDIDTKPKETSNMSKLMFREELADIAALVNLGAQPNIEDLQSRHSSIWGRKKTKAFLQKSSNTNPLAIGDVGRANQSGVSTLAPSAGMITEDA